MQLRQYVSRLTAATLFFAVPALAQANGAAFESALNQARFKFASAQSQGAGANYDGPAAGQADVSERLLILDMQFNAMRTVQLTMEGLNRLRASDAPGSAADKLQTLIEAAAAEHQAVKAAFAKDGSGSHEALVICAHKVRQMAALSEEVSKAKNWGGREIARMAAGMTGQLAAIRSARPDASLTPALKTHKLTREWQSFVHTQNAALARYETQLAQGELQPDEVRDLVRGRRSLTEMWELYQTALLNR